VILERIGNSVALAEGCALPGALQLEKHLVVMWTCKSEVQDIARCDLLKNMGKMDSQE